MTKTQFFIYFIIFLVIDNSFGQTLKITGYDDQTRRKYIANYTDNYLNGQYYEYVGKKKVLEGYFSKGFKSGTWLYYHDNGKLAIEVNYDENELNGIAKEFDSKGRIRAKISYKDNQRHGTCFIYSPKKDELYLTINYNKGELEGEVIENDERSKTIINYSKNKRNGAGGFIDANGDFNKITEYQDGKVVDDYIVYNLSLKPKEKYLINPRGEFYKKIIYEGEQIVEEVLLGNIDTSFMYSKYMWEEEKVKFLLFYVENGESNILAPIYYSE
ncbi:toxin-antitoxin system YwqK family antitoxin [Chondrinema litorale]|uniref:toxin-antitoxin system YwqK family antitoxin n=1 Tax=Chondrinema litorale TaxID=2994555 RepID=UPI002543158A|nr:hypothetical protein [Chondrinema litorale]UZR99901.1 hypothetical protein OQ292_39030 [Chondrinema litorale]